MHQPLTFVFLNTVDERPGFRSGKAYREQGDLFEEFNGLIRWAEELGVAVEWPTGISEKSSFLARIRRLRAVLFELFAAHCLDRSPPPGALKELNGHLAKLPPLLLTYRKSKFSIEGKPSDPFNRIVSPIVYDARDLLANESLDGRRLKLCGSDDCGWFFLDQSKNNSKRWCDMSGCGNREKARRFLERARG